MVRKKVSNHIFVSSTISYTKTKKTPFMKKGVFCLTDIAALTNYGFTGTPFTNLKIDSLMGAAPFSLNDIIPVVPL